MATDLSTWRPALDMSFSDLGPDPNPSNTIGQPALVIQCLWTGTEQPGPRITNLRTLQWEGIPAAGYIAIVAGHHPTDDIERGFSGMPPDIFDGLRAIAIDVELPGITYLQVQEACKLITDKGKKVCIYTSREIWTKTLNLNMRPPGVGLWLANWGRPPSATAQQLPFGGWKPEDLVAIQYQGDTELPGISVDLNLINPTWWLDAPAPTPPPELLPFQEIGLHLDAVQQRIDAIRAILAREIT